MKRGVVLGLTATQKVARAGYLAGRIPLSELDDGVRRDARTLVQMTGYHIANMAELDLSVVYCPTLYYNLPYPNGGTDPTAPDPASRVPGPSVTARLVDCTGGGMWCQGADRFAPGLEIPGYTDHVGHVRGSWLNCDSLILAAQRGTPWLTQLAAPEPGCVITCPTGAPGHERCGHQGTVVAVPPLWDPGEPGCWELLLIAECGGPPGATRSNRMTTGLRGWRTGRPRFIRVDLPPSPGVEV